MRCARYWRLRLYVVARGDELEYCLLRTLMVVTCWLSWPLHEGKPIVGVVSFPSTSDKVVNNFFVK